jgi:tRNA pseudouridine38-40 synthase
MLIFRFIGDGFLRNMVRNMVGTLLEAGRGRLTCEQFAEILAAKDRKMAGPTASPHGLTLYRVNY